MIAGTASKEELVVLHAVCSRGLLHVWGEHGGPDGGLAIAGVHTLRALVPRGDALAEGAVELMLPCIEGRPAPSPTLAHHLGIEVSPEREQFDRTVVPVLSCGLAEAAELLERICDAGSEGLDAPDPGDAAREGDAGDQAQRRFALGDSVWYFLSAARLGLMLLAGQRVVPTVGQSAVEGGSEVCAAWIPWLSDAEAGQSAGQLVAAMPGSARCAVDAHRHDGWAVTRAFIAGMVDARARRVFTAETLIDALEGRNPADPHVALLAGLLSDRTGVGGAGVDSVTLARHMRSWIGVLEDHGRDASWKLQLRLDEPEDALVPGDLMAPGDDVLWSLRFGLVCVDRPALVVDAADVWLVRGEAVTIEGRRLDSPQELLLAELGRAARVYPKLEGALRDARPAGLKLTTREAYDLLREHRPLLSEQEVQVIAPAWWDSTSARLGARLLLRSDPLPTGAEAGASGASGWGGARLGLNTLVEYEWRLAVGDTPLSLEEFKKLASQRAPLVRLNGQWVEIRPEHVRAALHFVQENPGGQVEVGKALRMAFARDAADALNITGVDAQGWVALLLGGSSDQDMKLPELRPPEGFHGTLREYQQRGVSWLAFLDGLGLGACLADDMGLGKTIQLLALLEHEREHGAADGRDGPTLLVVPMSIVRNWEREAHRFTPDLRVHVHHGPERLTGRPLADACGAAHLVVTTYGLAQRDLESLELVGWRRIVLDEAQNIKNPSAKQTRAVRTLDAPRRLALTGTPVENRLSELWSIMDFCNPGLLGTAGEFRRVFGIPIERHHDSNRSGQLREIVRPFVLRRLKTDPKVITDLPDKVETREFCQLTSEQAELYEGCVKRMLADAEASEGIRRRGVVLTALTRLKQICNHPAQVEDGRHGGPVSPARSGKCIRIIEMLDEVIGSGAQALVFTQFREMGDLLAPMLRHAFDRDVLFLHGGVPPAKRQEMVDHFQRGDGTAPIFILSLRAGGLGLNLTAATHVFHFDRWWNPAVENQATDRAFRIGQTKSVHVHKFIVSGTLEERIDQMIESKIELAEGVIGSGEDWLTEMSTEQLRDILTLRAGEAVAS